MKYDTWHTHTPTQKIWLGASDFRRCFYVPAARHKVLLEKRKAGADSLPIDAHGNMINETVQEGVKLLALGAAKVLLLGKGFTRKRKPRSIRNKPPIIVVSITASCFH